MVNMVNKDWCDRGSYCQLNVDHTFYKGNLHYHNGLHPTTGEYRGGLTDLCKDCSQIGNRDAVLIVGETSIRLNLRKFA